MRIKISEHWQHPMTGYTDETHAQKVNAHRLAREVLKKLARDYLMLPVQEYSIRSNMGGPAVSGEVLYRRCNGMKDYSGGRNHFAPIERLDDPRAFAMHLRGMATFGFVLPDETLRPGAHNGLSLHGAPA